METKTFANQTDAQTGADFPAHPQMKILVVDRRLWLRDAQAELQTRS